MFTSVPLPNIIFTWSEVKSWYFVYLFFIAARALVSRNSDWEIVERRHYSTVVYCLSDGMQIVTHFPTLVGSVREHLQILGQINIEIFENLFYR